MRLGLVLKYISDNVREGGGGRWNQGAKVIVVESERQGYMFIKLLSPSMATNMPVYNDHHLFQPLLNYWIPELLPG